MKKTIFVVLLAAFIAGIAIQDVKIMRKLKELKEQKRRTEELKEEAENLKWEIKLQKVKNDIEKAKKDDPFRRELERVIHVAHRVSGAKTDEELDEVLHEAVDEGIIKKPYEGDFNDFMSNPDNKLDFQ